MIIQGWESPDLQCKFSRLSLSHHSPFVFFLNFSLSLVFFRNFPVSLSLCFLSPFFSGKILPSQHESLSNSIFKNSPFPSKLSGSITEKSFLSFKKFLNPKIDHFLFFHFFLSLSSPSLSLLSFSPLFLFFSFSPSLHIFQPKTLIRTSATVQKLV